jgi:hypothetical protein
MSQSDEDLTTRLRRLRAVICPNSKYADEVERCPCKRGAVDAGSGSGHQTGCKDVMDAINELESGDE